MMMALVVVSLEQFIWAVSVTLDVTTVPHESVVRSPGAARQ